MPARDEGLYRLPRQDAARGAAMLADAFQEDPVWRALFDGQATLAQRRAAFETPLLYTCRYGQAWASSPALEGVIAWTPGQRARMSLSGLLGSGALWAGLRMGGLLSARVQAVFRPIEADREAHLRGREYLYVVILGVAPQQQGQGIGGRLLRAAIAESERQGLPLYLETETERNVAFYARHGFRTLQQVMLPIVNLPMWEMIREPATPGETPRIRTQAEQ